VARTPQEIFRHHAEALMAGDVEEIVTDYTEDALLITATGVKQGRDGVREGFTELLKELSDAEWQVPVQVFAGDVLYIEWSAVAGGVRVRDGVDTFVFTDEGIRAQTLHHTVEPLD
jgi:ketosteroid isomerase-like protein